MDRTNHKNHAKTTAANQNQLSSAKRRKCDIKTSDKIRKTKPLYRQINNFIERAGFFHDHNDCFLMALKEKLLSLGQLDWERHHGSQKQELMEIYGTDEISIDEEFKMELEQCLHEATRSSKTELIQLLKSELLRYI